MYIRFPSLINKIGASGGYDADAQAYFTAAGITDNTQKDAWNTFVTSAKTNSYWGDLFAVYPFMGGSSSSHAVNAKTPGTFNITWGDTVTHDSTGITGNGVNSTGNTTFDSTIGSGSGWTINSASYGCYVRSGFSGTSIIMGNSNSTYIYANSVTSVNCTFTRAANITTTLTKLIMLSMTSSEFTAYRDTTTSTAATGNLTGSGNVTILSGLGGYFTNANISFTFIASGLSTTKAANLNTDVNTLMTSLGRNV